MTKSIMFQGTASGVGKSTICAGVCRILSDMGYKVAPFKAQNFSDNSFMLDNERLIAASQAISAAACRIKPTTDMNPVLLIPKGSGQIEVILNGVSIGNMSGYNYKKLKTELLDEVIKAYNRLVQEYDIIVAEGAGSASEINLRQTDIVNMGFATKVDCPVVLVTDISRGGAFASVYGTIELMAEEEKELVKAIVINKFKGNIEYFTDGVKLMEKITKKSVLGVVESVSIKIQDEDSLTDNGVLKSKESILKELDGKITYDEHLDNELNLLAENLKKYIDTDMLLKIIGC